MSLYIDSHLHTSFSGDSETAPELQIEKAVSLGLPAICITDHQDYDYPPDESSFEFDTDQYFSVLNDLKEKWSKKIRLLIGVELGLQPSLSVDLKAYTDRYPFDYVIGSTHVCGGMDPYYPEFFEGRTPSDAWRSYFEEELENIRTWNCFDAAGHLDYVVRYAPYGRDSYNWHDAQDLFDEMLRILIDRGQGIECNTGAYKAGLSDPHPTKGLLKRYRELGGEIITLGSDAHAPSYLAHEFSKAGELLKECGFRFYASYEQRKPVFHSL